MNLAPDEIATLPVPESLPLKRKRSEVADSESEDEAGSENEYGWDGDEDLFAAEELAAGLE